MSGIATAIVGSAVIGGVVASNSAGAAADAQNRATDAQTVAAGRQMQLAEDQWKRYITTYGPLEEQFVDESKNYASNANKNKAAGEAAAAVTSAYAGLRDKLNRAPGINPNSQHYVQELSRIGLAEAASSATAQTSARNKVDAEGRARLSDAISLGKGLPASASSALNAAAGTYDAMGRSAAAAGQTAMQSGYGIGRMFGDLGTNKDVQQGIKSMFGTPGGIDTSSFRADDPYKVPGYVGGMEGE